MRKDIKEIIELPEGITAEISGLTVRLSKDGKSLEKKISYNAVKEGNNIVIECRKATKNEKKLINSSAAHIKNMLSGLKKNFVYQLQVCAVHFPINVSIKGQEVVIKNFLGETKERKAKILENTEVKIDKDIISVESPDKEKAGQTAANIENAANIKARDRRVFQDGIFITKKEKGAEVKND